MDHVGIILGLEMSRLARCDSDWHHLLELCGVFGTLLADQEGVYEPADPNDRLLLGLKGTISSVTTRGGPANCSSASPGICPAADRQGRSRSGRTGPHGRSHALQKFEELGTVRSVFLWMLHRNGVCLPIRPSRGPRKGELEWRRPVQTTVCRMLHHPMYAGAYAYGQRPVDPKRQYATGKLRAGNWLPIEQWQVLILDHLPAYITWERFLRNQGAHETEPDAA